LGDGTHVASGLRGGALAHPVRSRAFRVIWHHVAVLIPGGLGSWRIKEDSTNVRNL
jgi:hypothetical protein